MLDENIKKEFIRQVESVYVDFYGDIVVPIAKIEMIEYLRIKKIVRTHCMKRDYVWFNS